MRLVQIARADERRVGLVDGEALRLLAGVASVYELAQEALAAGASLQAAVESRRSLESLDYGRVYDGASEWHVLPAMDHPAEPARCLASGTGLTHTQSAKNRQAMHAVTAAPTDSMRMYQWGVEGGRPAAGETGTAPEWFYKGCGTVLRAHGEALVVPEHAEDGGEEPEIAGIYVIDGNGMPRRIGMAQGNEFSDHRFEKKNYLYLAASKLMTCAIGPELVLDADFADVRGEVTIERGGQVLWKKAIASGEANMCHSLANMEHHHFKHAGHRRAGDVHVHYFGADAFSFGEGVMLEDGDVMQVGFDGFGRPLRNLVKVDRTARRNWAATGILCWGTA
jgi:hypothetical protein